MSITEDTIAALKNKAYLPVDLVKAFIAPGSATTGLQAYNLEGPSKKLVPILTPLRNRIRRISGGFATQASWKAITNINNANTRAGVSEGRRGGLIDHTLVERLAAFRGMGLENSVTFEADYASRGYEDVKALAVSTTLQSLMIQEERTMLGGNTSLALGTTPTPVTATTTTGGTIAAATYSVVCVALGMQAYLDMVGANNGAIGQAFAVASSAVPGLISRTNADGTTETFGGGNAQQSSAASQATTGATSTLSATVAAVNGAVGYAWFVGASGAERLQAVTSINSVVLTSLVATGQLLSAIPGGAADQSQSTLDFDGLLTQAFIPGNNAFRMTMPTGTAGAGTGLTADNAGGIVEFEAAFVRFYNLYRLSPSVIFVSTQELVNIAKKVIQGSGAPLLQLTTQASGQTTIMAGIRVGSYLNKITGDVVPIVVHPNLAAGTIFFHTDQLPYVMNDVPDVCRMLMRQDYYQLEWPIRTRKYEYGVYADGVLQHYAPFSMGVITNIGNS